MMQNLININANDLGPYGCPFIVNEDGSITIQRIPKPVPVVTFWRQEVTIDPVTLRFRQDGEGDNILRHAENLFSAEKYPYIDAAAGPAGTGQVVLMSSLEVFLSSTVIPYSQKGCTAFTKDGKSDAMEATINHYRTHSADARVPRLLYCLGNVFCDDLSRCYLWVPTKRRLVCVNPGDTFRGSSWNKVGSKSNTGYSVTDSQAHKQAWYRLAFIAGWPEEYKKVFIQRCDADIHHLDSSHPNCCLEHNLAVINPCEHRDQHYNHEVDIQIFQTINTIVGAEEREQSPRRSTDRDPAGPSTAPALPASPASPASPQRQLASSAPSHRNRPVIVTSKQQQAKQQQKQQQQSPAQPKLPPASRPATPVSKTTPQKRLPPPAVPAAVPAPSAALQLLQTGRPQPAPAPCTSIASPAHKRLCADQDQMRAEAQERLLADERERKRTEEEWLRAFRLSEMGVEQPQAMAMVSEEEERRRERMLLERERRQIEEERRQLEEMRRSIQETQRQMREELQRMEQCRQEERQRVEDEWEHLKAEKRCLEEAKQRVREWQQEQQRQRLREQEQQRLWDKQDELEQRRLIEGERRRRERELRKYLADQEERRVKEEEQHEEKREKEQVKPEAPQPQQQPEKQWRPGRLVRHGSETNRLGNLRLVFDDNDDEDDDYNIQTQVDKPDVIVIEDDEAPPQPWHGCGTATPAPSHCSIDSFFPLTQEPVMLDI